MEEAYSNWNEVVEARIRWSALDRYIKKCAENGIEHNPIRDEEMIAIDGLLTKHWVGWNKRYNKEQDGK